MIVRVLLLRCVGAITCMLVLAGGLADQSAASCPNEAFSGFAPFLAGCAAYEQISPPFKAGARLFSLAVSADGTRVIGESIGVFAALEGSSSARIAFYESVQSGSGWATKAATPPSRLYPAQEFHDASADLTKTLWSVRSPSQSVATEDLAVREPDGSLVEVGPIVPPSAAEGPPAGEYQTFTYFPERTYAGASDDLSHVFFQINDGGPVWPGDTTVAGNNEASLYEYVGTGNLQPQLVGVDNEGHLISDCGTALGDLEGSEVYNADVYNAVSSDGKRVFFTARAAGCGGAHAPEVNELYSKTEGKMPKTVAISEPSGADCEACQTGARSAAEFQGASVDGSKAFFLTEQELLKGAVGMNLYEYDFSNRPGHKIIRVSIGAASPEVRGVARVSKDGSHVYFVARGVLTQGPNAEGDEPVGGRENLYVFERDATHPTGHLAFIATLAEQDHRDWKRNDKRPVQATPDGRFLVFQSVADLTNEDESTVPQVFEYDAAREELVRVSVGEVGYAEGEASAMTHESQIPEQNYAQIREAAVATSQLAISSDGAVVVFHSIGGLTRQAAAAGSAEVQSVYEYRSAGSLSTGRVFSVSSGDLFRAAREATDASGHDVFFETVDPATASDGDTEFDIYDARDGGGLLAPSVVEECGSGRLCRGEAGVAPVFSGAGSLLGQGSVVADSTPVPAQKPHVLSRTQQLGKALKACRRLPRARRRACEARTRRRFVAPGKSKRKGG